MKHMLLVIGLMTFPVAVCAGPGEQAQPSAPYHAPTTMQAASIAPALALAQQDGRRSRRSRGPGRSWGLDLAVGCTVETWSRGHRRVGSSRRRYLDEAVFGYDSCTQKQPGGRRPWVEIVWSVGTALDENIDIGYSRTKALAFTGGAGINPDLYTFQWRGACNSDTPTCRLDVGGDVSVPREAVLTVRQRSDGEIVLERVVQALAHR